MNVDISNIGHYRVTSHGGRLFDLFNRDTGGVVKINADQYGCIKAHMSVEMCRAIEAVAIQLR